MSGFIPGRQYRVTHTTTADRDGTIDCDFGTLLVGDLGDGVAVELLPKPLPTAVDAVVMLVRDDPTDRDRRMRLIFQSEGEDCWRGTNGARWSTSQLQDESDGHLHGELVVLYDPAVEW